MANEKEKCTTDIMVFEKENKNNKLYNPIVFEEPEKSFESKVFIILYKLYDDGNSDDMIDDNFTRIYHICLGRTEAYNDIISKVSNYDVDIHKSVVITETRQTETESGNIKYYLMPYKECATLYAFCKNVESNYRHKNFNIDDYYVEPDGDNGIEEDLKKSPMYLTPEQQEYKRILESNIHREEFIDEMRKKLNQSQNNEDSINI